jgi:hypothetical protein
MDRQAGSAIDSFLLGQGDLARSWGIEAAQLRLVRRVGSGMANTIEVAQALADLFGKKHPELLVRADEGVVRVAEAWENPVGLTFDLDALTLRDPAIRNPSDVGGWVPLLTLAWVCRAQAAGVLAFPPMCRRCKMPLRRTLRERDPRSEHRECRPLLLG